MMVCNWSLSKILVFVYEVLSTVQGLTIDSLYYTSLWPYSIEYLWPWINVSIEDFENYIISVPVCKAVKMYLYEHPF